MHPQALWLPVEYKYLVTNLKHTDVMLNMHDKAQFLIVLFGSFLIYFIVTFVFYDIYLSNFHITDVQMQATMLVWICVSYVAVLVPVCTFFIIKEIRRQRK